MLIFSFFFDLTINIITTLDGNVDFFLLSLIWRKRERERQRERDRERDRERNREGDRGADRDREIQRETATEKEI